MVYSAHWTVSREVAGSAMKSFSAGENFFHVKKINADYTMVFVTTADMESSFISLIFDEINKYFQEIKLFNLNINKAIPQDGPIYEYLDKILQSANIVYYENRSRQGIMKSVMEEGQIKIVFQFFHESAIILWRAILLGQRIIITGDQ